MSPMEARMETPILSQRITYHPRCLTVADIPSCRITTGAVCVCVSVYVSVYLCVCVSVCLYQWGVYACVFLCVSVCMSVYLCV